MVPLKILWNTFLLPIQLFAVEKDCSVLLLLFLVLQSLHNSCHVVSQNRSIYSSERKSETTRLSAM